MNFKDIPIRKKIRRFILFTSIAVFLLSGISYSIYEYLLFRKISVRDLSVIGEIVASNSTAALAFDSPGEAAEILAALKADPHILAAALYDKNGKIFSWYPESLSKDLIPQVSDETGYHFEGTYLSGFQPVKIESAFLGTLYIKSDLGGVYDRFQLFGTLGIITMLITLGVAYYLSKRLQSLISKPIINLAETANVISNQQDYSVRAAKYGEDELGTFTDAFNAMVSNTEKQNQALIESEERVRSIINSTLTSVILMSDDGKIMDWNTRAEKMFGWTYEEILGADLAGTIIPETYRKAHRDGLNHYLKTGEAPIINKLLEMTALRRDGTKFPVELSISSIQMDNKMVFCGFITDITERKLAEQQAKEMQNRIEDIIKSMGDAFVSFNQKWEYTIVNDKALSLIGKKREDLIGKTFWKLYPSVIGTKYEKEFRTVMEKRRPAKFETYVPTNGIWLEIRAYPHHDGIAVFYSDITDRMESANKVQAQLSRLDLLSHITRAIGERQDLDSIYQVAIQNLEDNLPIDFGCVCVLDNMKDRLFVKSIGKKSDDLLTKNDVNLAAIEIDQNGLSKALNGILVYEAEIFRSNSAFLKALSGMGLHSIVIAPLAVESQAFGLVVCARTIENGFSSGDCEFLKQLSEHIALAAHNTRLHEALQMAYDDLRNTQNAVLQQERLKALGQMSSGIAHDINNAISPISLYTESLLASEPNLSEKSRNYLEIIQQAIDDVTETVARMREFYRQREPQLNLTEVNLNVLVKQVVDLTKAKWSNIPQQQGIVINIKTDLAENLPTVPGVESELREALTNLIFNAVDSMPEGGDLQLKTMLSERPLDPKNGKFGRFVLLEITDTGIGMDNETKKRCLEPFYTTKGERGTGLGLSMVFGVVQRHNADMEVDSEQGKGSTFRLIFSIRSESTTTHPSHVIDAIPKRRKILVIDDDPLLLKSLNDTLEIDGHVVVIANGGQDGVNAFLKASLSGPPFDVVFTDLGMPYMDGRKVAKEIKNNSPTTPIVLLTGWGQRILEEGDIPQNVDRVLSKPPKIRELREALLFFEKETSQGK